MDKCPGCGTAVKWSGIYGNWCSVCKPRDLPLKKEKR